MFIDILRREIHRLEQTMRARFVHNLLTGGNRHNTDEQVEHGAVSATRACDDVLLQWYGTQ